MKFGDVVVIKMCSKTDSKAALVTWDEPFELRVGLIFLTKILNLGNLPP
jgi:hypothetical protein